VIVEYFPKSSNNASLKNQINYFLIQGGIMNVVTLTDDNFDTEVYKSDKPVLVDYWATWCGPCKMVGPIVEEIAIELSDKIKVGKLDVDANQTSAAQQNVMSIPTLAIFKGGELIAQQVGALSKTQLTEFIESNL
tara:strand:+ start:18144 stop:18548 length:405 start_codon:yes stop_codon:yes gene_type:complete